MNRSTTLIAVLLVCFLSGCASVSGRAAARATSRSVQELGNEQVQEDFAGFMRSPSVMKAWQDLGQSAGRGIALVVSEEAPEIVEELAAAEHSHRLLGALARTAAREIVHEMDGMVDEKLGPVAARVIQRDIGPAMAGVIRQDVGPAIVESFDGRLDPVLARSAGVMLNEVVRVMSTGIEKDLGPAAARAIRQDIGPAVTQSIDAELEATLARSARTLARESVLGSHEGLVELREQPDSLFGGAMRFGIGAVQLVVLAGGIALGLLIGLLVQSKRNERRERARADEREATLLEVVRALRQEPVG